MSAIAIAQTFPVKGDVDANRATHLRFIREAAKYSAGLILFPELSLTGYEADT